MSEKKASDIILELQDQVKHLTRLVSNQDNNLKLIIKKLNALERSAPSPKVADYYQASANPVSVQPSQPSQASQVQQKPQRKFLEGADAIAMKVEHARQQPSAFEQMAADIGVDVSGESQVSVGPRGGRIEQPISLSEAKEFSGQARGRRVDRVSKDKPVSVSQLLVIQHGGSSVPLPLATVKITDRFGQTVKSSRTNTKGRWNISLNPGEYNVQILKNFVSDPNKKPVELQFGLTVTDNGTGKMEIPSPNLEG